MQTLKFSLSLPHDTHPDMELRLSANDTDCDVVISLPMRMRSPAAVHLVEATDHDVACADDDYVLGGYSGI